MKEYNEYVTAINKIFDYLAKMKAGWNSLDNLNYIESIEEYKQLVASSAENFKTTKTPPKEDPETIRKRRLEALGND